MGDFECAAHRILDAIREGIQPDRKINPAQIHEILGLGGRQINCYPGIPGEHCHDIAFFVSLKNKKYATGRGHLGFGTVLRLLVKHMQGTCADATRCAVIISDSWDDEVYDEWRANIENIKQRYMVEAYLITAGKVSSVNI